MEPAREKAPQEQARESLIAIAYSSPNDFRNFDVIADKKDTAAGFTTIANGDEAERLRSELISISYAQPPDVSKLPNGFCHG